MTTCRPVSNLLAATGIIGIIGAMAAIVLAVSGCGRNGGDAGTSEVAPLDGPNIILISVDTLRPDHLGCYGYERETSPRIDALAAEGAVFENAISSTSWTLPAHAALFTGLADSVPGCYDTDKQLDPSRVTMAERLSALGYDTVGFFSGPYLHPVFGLGQGFDEYEDCSSYERLSLETVAKTGSIEAARIDRASHEDITNPRVYERVSAWLETTARTPDDGAAARPFFMFIHMWDVHFDYIPPAPYDTMFDPDYEGTIDGANFFFNDRINPQMSARDLEHVIALYDGEIAWTDDHIGRILDDVERLGLTGDTIVALVSDHGTEFFEHGGKIHRRTLYDEVIRIPLIIRYPGHVTPGARHDEQVRLIDVMPTLLDLAGADRPGDVMGQSLVPVLAGGTLGPDTIAISELFTVGRELRSFRRSGGKLISDEKAGQIAMFDLRSDPGESAPFHDVSAEDEWVQALLQDKRQATKWLDGFRAAQPAATATSEIPEALRRQLQSLGYLGGGAPGGDSKPGGP